MEKIFENESSRFYYDNNTRIFKAEFFGIVNVEKILEAFGFVIKNSEKFDTLAVLTDLRELKGTFTMLMDYFENQLFPYLASKGILCDAVILNQDAFTQFSVFKLVRTINLLQIKGFEDEESALEWINNIISENNAKNNK